MTSIEAKEKFVEWLLSEIPTTKTDYRVYEAWLWFRKVASYYLSWQEAMKQLQVMRAKYNGLEKTKKWNRRFFIKRFGFIKGEYWYLLAKRPRKRLETEETEKWREEFKNPLLFVQGQLVEVPYPHEPLHVVQSHHSSLNLTFKAAFNLALMDCTSSSRR